MSQSFKSNLEKAPKIVLALGALVLLCFIGVSSLWHSAVSFFHDDTVRLHVYTWSDYIEPDLIAQFEEANNCKVIIDTFDDNETMLAKLLAGGGGYDVLFPSSYTIPVMVRAGMLAPLDPDLLSNVATNFDNKYKNLLQPYVGKYSVPYALSVTGVAYRKDKVDPANPLKYSWTDILNPCWNKRVSILRDIREMIGIGLILSGKSVNTTNADDVAAAVPRVIELKRGAVKMDNEAYRAGLASGEILACIGYLTDVLQIMFENENTPIGFFVPKEGGTCCWDEMVIAASSEKKELAHKFIDFLYDPKVAAKNMAYICSPVPNSGMLEYLDEMYRDNPFVNMKTEEINKLKLIEDVGSNLGIYSKAWDTITNARCPR